MLNLLFPKTCGGCSAKLRTHENVLCASCKHNLPIACFHRNGDETIKNILYGRVPIESATALVYFQKKGITQQLLHNLKYRGQQEIGTYFGNWLGIELSENSSYSEIDIVIPVPLHKKKLKKRGYNQVTNFANTIATHLNASFRDDILVKVSDTSSQVFKQRFSRFETPEIFTVRHPEILKDKHVLLVDDIVTTGATIEKCANQLLLDDTTKLSVATIAIVA